MAKTVVKKAKTKKAKTAMVSKSDQEVIAKAKAALAKAKAKSNVSKPEHLVVIARAGTGKTFTLVEGLNKIRGTSDFSGVPSQQQEEIWKYMQRGKTPITVLFCTFNRNIAQELQSKVPTGCQASTIHSLGNKAVRRAYGKVKMNKWKIPNLMEQISGMDYRELRKNRPSLVQAVQKLADLCRMTLAGWSKEEGFSPENVDEECINELCNQYGIEMNGDAEDVYAYVPEILELARDVPECGEFDYADMIWLPVVNKLATDKYDLLLVDEAQDLNACQQQFVLQSGKRIIACGDPKQAIYGFAGADTESMTHLIAELTERDKCVVRTLPLNVTFRCCKAVVEEAKKIVSDYTAWEQNMVGDVVYRSQEDLMRNAREGEMVLCRTNAPLIGMAFRLIASGKKATIKGNDIGKGLISLVFKMKAFDVGDLMGKIDDYYHEECKKLQQRRLPPEAQLIALEDKRNCIMAFCEGCLEIEDVVKGIEEMFVENQSEGIVMSSIHRAKGLEAYVVYVMHPELLPHPMASTKWQREQEANLKYVGITRAIERLVWVRE